MKKLPFFLFFISLACGVQAQQLPAPKVWYSFENGQTTDQSGNGYDATLHGSARVKTHGSKGILSLGSDQGYLDLGQEVGKLFGSLSDFTISTYVYLPASNTLDRAGNLIASFSHSEDVEKDGHGYALLGAKDLNYSISRTNSADQQTVHKPFSLPAKEWKLVTYVQKGNVGKLYIDGEKSPATHRVLVLPKDLGATPYNWIGRSCFANDAYLNNGYVDEFRLYDQALTAAQVKQLSKDLESYKALGEPLFRWKAAGNPIITHKYTADAATLVHNDTLWIFTGEDYKGGQGGYHMRNWCVFSTTDMQNYTEYHTPLYGIDFKWSSKQAYAGHVTERNGKFYFYVSTNSTGIGVAVSDRPEGPYKDALGKPLLTNKDCFDSKHSWACIDPAVFVDSDGQAWIFWGNRECYYAKLKENMIEIDGPVKRIEFEGFSFTEAPWIHTRDGKYYLTYASGFPEKISYATSDHIEGPWEYKGILNEVAGNSNTNHQAIVDYRGKSYFVYHNGVMQTQGTSYSRSVCVDELYYNPDGTLKRMIMTTEGVDPLPPLQTAP